MAAKKQAKPIAKKVKVSSLRPMGNNPRNAIAEAMPALTESLLEFGIADGAPCSIQPIVVNTHPEAKGEIVSGHRRWEAVKEYGFGEVWVIPVKLEPAKARELCIRLNVTAGDWDWDLLMPHAGELAGWGFTALELPAVSGTDAEPLLPFEMPTPTILPATPPSEPPDASGGEFASPMSQEEIGEAWSGMPEFEAEYQGPTSQIIVSFKDDTHREAFGEAIGQIVTPATRSVWFPAIEQQKVEGVVIYDDADPEGEEG